MCMMLVSRYIMAKADQSIGKTRFILDVLKKGLPIQSRVSSHQQKPHMPAHRLYNEVCLKVDLVSYHVATRSSYVLLTTTRKLRSNRFYPKQ